MLNFIVQASPGYSYINFILSIIFSLSSGDTYLSLGISLSCSFVIISELFCSILLETFLFLSAMLLPIRSPVASAVFLITLIKVVLSASAADCFA